MRTILITGATDGMGRNLARRLAEEGDRVILHGRDAEKVRLARENIGGSGESVLADLADLRQVDRMADEVLDRFERLDVLVNNAGIGFSNPEGRHESKDGIELRFAVNYVAGYHLTRRLLPLLRMSAPARVVNVSSVGQAAIDFSDPMLTKAYDGVTAYCQSKLAQIMFTFDLAAELVGTGVTINALHPATYMDTTMVRAAGVTPASTVEEGVEATLNLVNAADGVSGQYFNQLSPARPDAQADDPGSRARLRELTDDLIARALA